jgi:hypothetical protein
VAPGRNFVGVCFLEVTSHSIFWPEPGRNLFGHLQPFVRVRWTLGKLARNDGFFRSAIGVLGGPFWEAKTRFGRALKCCLAEFLMCVLAPVRNFPVVCFLGVTTNSVGGALSIRSGLDHSRICAEILEFCDGFKLGIDGLQRIQCAPSPDKLGTPPFRFDCASQNLSIIVTKKRSTRFYEIQGPVCVDGLVLRGNRMRIVTR